MPSSAPDAALMARPGAVNASSSRRLRSLARDPGARAAVPGNEGAWAGEATQQTHQLGLRMAQLRARLEDDPGEPCVLLTKPGVGYRIAEASVP